MNWLKQAALILIAIAIAGAVWLRFDPQAGALVTRYGFPQQIVSLITGKKDQAAGEQNGGAVAGNGGRRTNGGPGGGTLVVTDTVGSAAINDRVTAIGDGEALRSVTVVPLSAGTIESVDIEPGHRIEQGDVLFRLDAEVQRIARDRADLAVKIASEKVERTRKLVESRTVTAVQLTEAENELANAALELRDAQLELERRSVIAPIAGIVGIVPVEAGDYVTPQTEMATIDDRSAILLDFYVPERFASLVRTGQKVDAESIALPGLVIGGEITAIGSRVDRESRTLQIRATLGNADDQLRPGMSFRVRLSFTGETHPAVPPLSIQWSSDGAFVWKETDGAAQRVAVRIIQRNSDYVLVSADLEPGDRVVTEGVQNLRPGMPLRTSDGSASTGAAGS